MVKENVLDEGVGLLLKKTTSPTASMISEIFAGFPPGPVISNLPSTVFHEVAILGWAPVRIS